MQFALKRPKLVSSLILFAMVSSTILVCAEIIPKNQFKDLLYFNFSLFAILSVEMLLKSLIYPFYCLSLLTIFPIAFLTTMGLAFTPKPKTVTKKMFGILLSPTVCPILIVALQAYLSANNNDELLIYKEDSWPYQLLHTLLISCVSLCTAVWMHFNITSTDKELKWFTFWILLAQAIICLQFYLEAIMSKMPAAHW
ncbi:MAG: hypothetical protein SFY67_07845 [Candidatus Melainabacteria bacterium]|nr:hypothetical protein [Candidatus Melainabacteria bacterium]